MGQEATVGTGLGMTGSKLGNEHDKTIHCHPVYLTYIHTEHTMCTARLDEPQTGIKTAGRNTNNLRYAVDTTLMAEGEEELKSFLMRVKEESVKLKTQN